LSTISINAYIPEVWAAELLSSLKAAHIYGGPSIVNRNYEGEIRNAGDTVRITSISRPTVANYVPGVTSIVPEQLTDSQRTLVVDQSKYFSFEVDDVDARQAAGSVMAEGMREAAYALSDIADRFIAGLYTGTQSANVIGTSGAPVTINSGALAYTNIINLNTKLDEANVPSAGRWVVISPAYHAYLLQDSRFTDASASGQASAAITGMVGIVAGMNVIKTNNTPNPTGSVRAIIAGTRDAISFAEQINKTEAFRPESSFSDAVKGLHLYGAKLVRPDGIAVLNALVS
jgi:N4-gp56 family major capsid protein